MKILIDMQGVQTDSRHRGIGRYCLATTQAFIELSRDAHETLLLFNAALDGIDEATDILTGDGLRVVRRAVGPIRDTSSDNRANDARRVAAEHVFSHALQAHGADVVWLGSVVEGFADDALVSHTMPAAFTVATLYDLIPLHDPEYLGHARARDWYTRRIDVLKQCDLLFAISEWVRADAIARLGVHPDRIVAIGAGVEARFAPPATGTDHRLLLRERFRITRPFVMYNGGFDKRKNVLGLVKAYASLPAALRASHLLVVVGRIDAASNERFAEVMNGLGLSPDEVIFTGFVSDDDLVRLYQSCALFVFPSEREGFGLTPLEAMACGAPALVNNATSLPEVVGNQEALFDARDIPGMAARIEATLTDSGFAARLRCSGLERAAHFTWRAVAARALAAIEAHASAALRQPRPNDSHPAPLPIYRMDATNVEEALPRLRQWPGAVVWTGPLPDEGPQQAADRFRVAGYAGLVKAMYPTDWLSLIEADAAGMVCAEDLSEDDLRVRLDALRAERPLARQRSTEQAIATSIAPLLSDDDLARIADALSRAAPAEHVRWLVDVTHIATKDLGTGVHRVVRSILREWLVRPPAGVRIEPVEFREGRYHHAHRYACRLIGADAPDGLPGDIVGITGNERYIGLDWTMESLPSSAPLLRTWRRAGVAMHFVVYDLLPLTMPDAFHAQSRERFEHWMTTIAGLADTLHCISRATAQDVATWLETHKNGRRPAVNSFELGAEAGAMSSRGELDATLTRAMSARPSLLMVGTVEPRKGHEQLLEAVELLWNAGTDINLVIVGHRGWLVNKLVERLQQHPEKSRRLFWLDDADDATLEAVYERSTALVAASLGEGYGLPLIEAALRGKPIIARSLPVFREVVGDYPFYFDTDSAEVLSKLVAQWLIDRPAPGAHPAWLTWAESATSLRKSVGNERGSGTTGT
jgi:glycosyltransferase involved in cell wall biosynthesis